MVRIEFIVDCSNLVCLNIIENWYNLDVEFDYSATWCYTLISQ